MLHFMIYGIGIDQIEVQRLKNSFNNTKSFKEKVFSKNEIELCENKPNPTQSYAARFAAKEAFLKALGTGWSDGISWLEIEILNLANGTPHLLVSGKAKEILLSKNITILHVSLSHLKDIASAIVILETN